VRVISRTYPANGQIRDRRGTHGSARVLLVRLLLAEAKDALGLRRVEVRRSSSRSCSAAQPWRSNSSREGSLSASHDLTWWGLERRMGGSRRARRRPGMRSAGCCADSRSSSASPKLASGYAARYVAKAPMGERRLRARLWRWSRWSTRFSICKTGVAWRTASGQQRRCPSRLHQRFARRLTALDPGRTAFL
jgi:hypothetical protein